MNQGTLLEMPDTRSAVSKVSSRRVVKPGTKRGASQKTRGHSMTSKPKDYATAGLEDITRLALDIQGITPLSMMFRGFGVASHSFAINSLVAQHLQDAALTQAQSMMQFGHVVAGIWIEPEPVGPISVASKVNRTQDALLHHIQATADDSLDRFQVFNEIVTGQ